MAAAASCVQDLVWFPNISEAGVPSGVLLTFYVLISVPLTSHKYLS